MTVKSLKRTQGKIPRERFYKNPAAHISEEKRAYLCSPEARKKYVDISYEEAEKLGQLEEFYRLFALGELAHLAATGASGESGKFDYYAKEFDSMHDKIARKNTGLVYKMIGGQPKTDLDDLESEGFYALARAIDKFNPWSGYHFSTYACFAIIRAVGRSKKKQYRNKERFRLLTDPSAALDIPVENYELSSDNTERFLKNLPKILINPDVLDFLDAEVISSRFPKTGEKESLESIGRRIGLSKERVRQIQNKALVKLRFKLEELVV